MNNYPNEYRTEFIDFIDKLSNEYDSFKWRCSSVSEKNIVCYNSLYKILSKDELENTIDFKFCLKNYYKSRRRFVVEKFKDIFDIRKIDISKNYIGLLTWIDKRNFYSENNFKETYYSELYEYLKKKENFLLLINPLYSIEKSVVYKKLRNEKIEFIDLFKCYNKIDVLKSICLSLFYNPIKSNIFFQNKNIKNLLKNFFLKDLEENRSAQYYLMYYSIKRIAEAGIKFDRLIYPFENQPWEKVLCFAVRKFMPKTKLIAYMHTMSLPNLVSMFPGKYEKDNMPQPDYIFTSGKHTADELKKYWKPEKIVENCAFRYEYLFEKAQSSERRAQSENNQKVQSIERREQSKKNCELRISNYELNKIDKLNNLKIQRLKDSKNEKSSEKKSDIAQSTSNILPDTIPNSSHCTLNSEFCTEYKSSSVHRASNITHRAFTILLALSVDYKKSLEMIKITYASFKDKKGYKIIIKPHPTYEIKSEDINIAQSAESRAQRENSKELQSSECRAQNEINGARCAMRDARWQEEEQQEPKTNNKNLDIEHSTSRIAPDTNSVSTLSTLQSALCTIKISDSPVSELLPQCDLVVTSESTVGLEGIKLGKPMIELDVKGFIPLSRFDYCPEIKISASDSNELFAKANEVLNWNLEQKNQYFEKANEFIDYCFNKPNEKYINEFVEI
ncbi:MAG TPA: hypothetical protein PKY81_14530 [bacterium]|nr:hypothetical protein [bacterium]